MGGSDERRVLKGEWMGWIRRAKGVKRGVDGVDQTRRVLKRSGWGGSDDRRVLKREWMGWIRGAKGVKRGVDGGGSDERRVLKREWMGWIRREVC